MADRNREPIRGKVARILNSRELALNVGRREGVKTNMVFEVLDPKGEDITDPDTKEVLGSVRRPKIQVKIIQVEERVSLASTFRSWEVNVGGSSVGGLDFTKLFGPPKIVTKYETLKAESKDWEDLDEIDSIVKVGDPVVELIPKPSLSATAHESSATKGD